MKENSNIQNSEDMASTLYQIYSTHVVLYNRQHLDLKLETPDKTLVPIDINLEFVVMHRPGINEDGTLDESITVISLIGDLNTISTPFEKFRTVFKSFWYEKNKRSKQCEKCNTK